LKHIIFKNKKIFYRAEGKGKPVMLLHGFAEDGNIWNHQLKKLKEKFLVIVPDIPGSGSSELLDGEIFMEDYADVIKTIVDAEFSNGKQKQFTLIGHSMGGYITLAFAQKYPGLLNAFGLFHSTAYADDDVKKEIRKKGIEFIKTNGAHLFLKNTTANLFSEKTKKITPWLIDTVIKNSTYFSPAALIQYYNAMMQRPDQTNVLKTFKKPILFIIGKNDNAVPLKASLKQCHIPLISYIKILRNTGHMGMWEETLKCNKYLINFFTLIE
jgi:pimeloyl-ACP methyl ester carboxylesterase